MFKKLWFEIHFAGGLGGGAGGWGKQLFSLSAHDVLRPEVVSVEVKCYFRSTGWLTDKSKKEEFESGSGTSNDPLSSSSSSLGALDIDDNSFKSQFPVLSLSQCKPVATLLADLKLDALLPKLASAGVASVRMMIIYI
jgi:hypothetical protein